MALQSGHLILPNETSAKNRVSFLQSIPQTANLLPDPNTRALLNAIAGILLLVIWLYTESRELELTCWLTFTGPFPDSLIDPHILPVLTGAYFRDVKDR